MPRTIRIQYPGGTYHVYARGNEKKEIFLDDDDRFKMMSIIERVKRKFKFKLYAFVLMPNHYHFLLGSEQENLGKLMQCINTAYSVYFNYKYKRVGHLFQGRYNSILVGDDDYFLELTRYIHLNPSRKMYIDNLETYRFSSLPEYLGRKGFKLCDVSRAFKFLSADMINARRRYVMFLSEGGRISEDKITQDMFRNLIVGSAEFALKVGDRLKARKPSLAGRLTRGSNGDPEKLIDAVSRSMKVDKTEIFKKRGKSNFAKKAAIYLLWKNTVLTHEEIGAVLDNVHASNISRTLKAAVNELENNKTFATLVNDIQTQI